jgi:hypothetical protein
MGRIIKALILGWIGKKIYDRVAADEPRDEASKTPAKAVPQAKRAAPKRTARKPARRAA